MIGENNRSRPYCRPRVEWNCGLPLFCCGGRYPISLPDSKLQAWHSVIINSGKNMPLGLAKASAVSALKAGRVEGRIFKWPQ